MCTPAIGGTPPSRGVVDDAGATQVQQFVGYANLKLYLRRIAPTFPTVSRVTLAGVSAGGFGVVNTYSLVARAFANVPVDMIDDSGPPMEDPYLAICQQAEERILWGLDETILADCGSDCAAPSSVLLDYTRHLVRANPQSAFGLVTSTADNTTTSYVGFGYNNCAGFQPLSASEFATGLLDIDRNSPRTRISVRFSSQAMPIPPSRAARSTHGWPPAKGTAAPALTVGSR